MYRLRVLGGFALGGPPGSPAPLRPQRRGDAVLAVLALCGDLGCSRDRLVALLWPESDEGRARQGLRDALYAIRRALAPGAVPSDGRPLRLDPAVVASDVRSFAQALACGRPADAVREYAGPLLDGFHVDDAPEFERWLDVERGRFAREYAEALERLAAAAERAGAWHEALGWWGRAVEHDPLNSHFVLQQLRAMAAIGDRANALRTADAHIRRLREELDLEPDGQFLADIERIRGGETPARRGGMLHLTPGDADRPEAAARSPLPHEPPVVAAPPTAPAVAPGRTRRWVWWATGGTALAVLAGALAVARRLDRPAEEVRPPRTAIAVLPFHNRSPDTSHAYFADGLHDEVLTQLGKVASLRVVGRTSTSGYEESSKPLRQIGAELAVGSIVEASVQVVGSRLRVIVQLLDPATQTELWSERYERSVDSAFAVQSDIARRIAAAVGATLTSVEAEAIAAAPTRSPEAYDFYLQGLEYRRRPGALRQNLESAQRLYQRAVTLDPDFALAHAALAYVDWLLHRLKYDRGAAGLEAAQRETDLALRLAPGLPQAHLAAGLVRHLAHGDSHGALREFAIALRGAPNDVEAWGWIGRAHRKLGDWDSALVAFDHARRLDPRDAVLLHTIGDTFQYLHRYRDAVEAYRRESALAPDLVEPRLAMAWSYVLWKGELDTLRAVLRGLPPDADPGGGGPPVGIQHLSLLLWERHPDSVLALLRLMPVPAGASAEWFGARALDAAQAHVLRGDSAAAVAGFDSAAAAFTAVARARPDDWGVHGDRGLALAWVGRRADALREAQWLARSAVYREDHFNSAPAQLRARILVRSGATDSALAEIERLLARPSLLGVGELRLSPEFDPIRADPRFQALLARYSGPG